MPPDLPAFTGRQDLLRRLDTVLRPASDAVAVSIVGLEGVAGVGKSSLAVHAAHRWRDRFPDGVVWADVRSENAACDALRLIARLYGFHQQAAQVGDAPRPLAALVRTILQGKRVLLVFDNADGLTLDELDGLLLGVPGTVTVVTSRRALPALERLGEPIRVDVMDEGESLALFRRLVGPERVGADPDAHLALARRLGHLPLALDIAARCMGDRGWSPAEMLRRLDQAADLPTFLALPIADEAQHGVALAFALSYEALDESDRVLFRALSVFAPPGFIARDVAAVLDTDDEAAIQAALDRLEALSLARPSAVSPRYDLHTLLRDYACALADRAGESDAWAVRHARHFLALANSAGDQLDDPASAFQAVAVAAVERANFLAAQQECLAQAFWDEVVSLAYRLDGLFERAGQWSDQRRVLEAGMHAAREAGNQRDEAELSARLGVLAGQEGDYAEARDLYQRATATFEKLGARQEQAALLDQLATLVCQQGEYAEARRLYQQSLDIAQALGDRAGVAVAIRNLGRVAHRQGDEDSAGARYQEAVAIFRELGDRKHEAGVLHELGVLAQARGDYRPIRSTNWAYWPRPGAIMSGPAACHRRRLRLSSNWAPGRSKPPFSTGWGDWPGIRATTPRPAAATSNPSTSGSNWGIAGVSLRCCGASATWHICREISTRPQANTNRR